MEILYSHTAQFARTKGAKDKKLRKPKGRAKHLLRKTLKYGAILGAGGAALTGGGAMALRQAGILHRGKPINVLGAAARGAFGGAIAGGNIGMLKAANDITRAYKRDKKQSRKWKTAFGPLYK